MRRVLIVGGGASGVLLAAHLLRDRQAPIVVTIVEQHDDLGAGIAYSTKHPDHLLNVRASNMSAYADDEEHFVRWLKANAPPGGPDPAHPLHFAPRHLYRGYLTSLLAPHFEQGRLRRVQAEAVALVEDEAGVRVEFRDGASRSAELVILATGNEGPSLPRAPWRHEGWSSSPLPHVAADAPVLLVGTGLTMVDRVLSLLQEGHRGPITAISPHGLIPQVHRLSRPLVMSESEVPFGASLSATMSWLRRRARAEAAAGGDWRSVIDAVRPHTQRLWQALSLADRRRFFHLGRVWWDQHRHRIAPDAAAKLEAARARGQLRIVAGRALAFEPRGRGVDVLVVHSKSGTQERLPAEAVFECRGRATDVRRTENPILQALLTSGPARPDPLNLGLDVTEDCAVIDAAGRTSERIFALGPVTSGVFWEIIAVPDIRVQAARLAGHLRSSDARP